MSFSWNKWRQYVIEEASVNEIDEVGELTPFFQDAADMGIIRKVDAQRVMDAADNSEDQDHFESTQEFQQIGKDIIMAAVDALEKSGRETHYLHQAFAQGSGKPIEGADISNAVNILRKGGAMTAVGMALPEVDINPEADEIDFDNVVAGAEKRDQVVGKRKPGFSNDVIINSFMEDFDKATRSTGDIQYAQEEVIKAYKTTFKNFPGVSDAIDAAVADFDRKARRDVFQNVADNPEVRGMDMMGESYENDPEFAPEMPKKGSTFEKGQTVYLKVDKDKQRPMKIKRFGGLARMSANPNEKEWVVTNADGDEATYTQSELIAELEGEVQTEIDAFDEAQNDMAIEKAMTATKLDALQNDLEATLSQEEIDALSDAIVLLRKKENLDEALDSKALIKIFQALGNVEEEFGTKLGDKDVETLNAAADIIKNLARK